MDSSPSLYRIPQDDLAEKEVIGIIVATRYGYAQISGIVEARDFYDLMHRRVFELVPILDATPHVFDGVTLTEDWRISLLASWSGWSASALEDLVRLRTFSWDASVFARRVHAAGTDRRRVETLETELAGLVGA